MKNGHLANVNVYWMILVAIIILLVTPAYGCTSKPISPKVSPGTDLSLVQSQPPALSSQQQPVDVPRVGLQIGYLAPDFTFSLPGGEISSLNSFRGRFMMLNFWATWCSPCRFEMPFLQNIYGDKRWSDKGLKIFAVNSNEPSSRVQAFLKTNSFSFPVLLDVNGNITQAYNIRALPTTFLIDVNGIILDVKIGAFLNQGEIEKLLNTYVR
jgi:peroxiredoxin